jgi:hypothetical protein
VAAKGYKIKMDDGSEVGPMTLEAVEGWYRQGLVKHDNMVQRPDSYKWVPLSEILARDLKKKEEKERVEQVRQAVAAAPKPAPAQPRPRPKPAPAAAPEPKAEPVTIDVPAGLWKGVIALLLLGGLAGAGYYGYKTVLQESEHSQRVREFQSEVKSEPATGFQVPAGWVALRSEQQFFSVPSSARLLLAHARSGAFAFVASEISPQGIGGVDQYLDAMLARRKRAGLPSYKEESRRDAAPGGLPGREATAVWGSDDPRQQELVRVWKDGWNYNAIVAWAVQGKPDGAAAIAALSDGVPTGGVASAQLAKVIDEVTREVPHFTRAVAESLMAQSAAQVLEPAEAFRRGNALMSRGIPALSPAEGRELGALMQAVYSTMQARDRSKLSGYIDRLRARSLTTPQDDREMCFVMKGGVLKLPAARRARLQALFEKAIAAGLKVPG